MSNEFWDGSDDEQEEMFEDESVGSTYIRINGSTREVEIGASFAETVKTNAIDAGLGKFRVFLNGEEVKPSEAPTTIQEGMKIDVSPYDVAGA